MPKCSVCQRDGVSDDSPLCDKCVQAKRRLETMANTMRRPLIAEVLVHCNFNVVDLDSDEECPIQCGFCCETGWSSVLSLRYKFGELPDCPHLTTEGCELPRGERPNGCVSFLCRLARYVKAGRLSVDEARTLLDENNGDTAQVAWSLDRRCITFLKERMSK
jgi:hypothetical protein